MLLIILILVGYIVYDQINEHFNDRDPKLNELKNKLEILISSKEKSGSKWTGNLQSLNNRDILNEIKLYVGSKSYTINKTRIYMCLKDSNDNYYDDNSLIFVLLHELAHVICKSIGHTDEFHNIFNDLLVEAEKVKIYNSKIPMIKNYCGHN
jgi:Zn-dependent peptidase ImmA (M78 family)